MQIDISHSSSKNRATGMTVLWVDPCAFGAISWHKTVLTPSRSCLCFAHQKLLPYFSTMPPKRRHAAAAAAASPDGAGGDKTVHWLAPGYATITAFLGGYPSANEAIKVKQQNSSTDCQCH
jgi:hypothetical protein